MDDALKEVINESIQETLQQMVISSPRSGCEYDKVKVRPVILKGTVMFQETKYRSAQVFHDNMSREEANVRLNRYLTEDFKRGYVETGKETIDILISKKNKVTVKRKRTGAADAKRDLSHNRVKQYILTESVPVPFLIDLGVQTKDGQVIRAKYDKFKQINRYLELIRDVLPTLLKEDKLQIIDFGCGKSYLTFAMYYYLNVLHDLKADIIGLDLKEEVITKCNQLAKKYGYDKLHFLPGNIADYHNTGKVDMVVSLHACDTATDYAIYQAVRWGAKVILAVPCCQHEVNGQLESRQCQSILKYGLIKERLSALLTDAIRADLLEEIGYEVQILEFIDMEHTPKNIMIRAVKNDRKKIRNDRSALYGEVKEVTDRLQIETTLQKLLYAGKEV